jgi:hypothetical protein
MRLNTHRKTSRSGQNKTNTTAIVIFFLQFIGPKNSKNNDENRGLGGRVGSGALAGGFDPSNAIRGGELHLIFFLMFFVKLLAFLVPLPGLRAAASDPGRSCDHVRDVLVAGQRRSTHGAGYVHSNVLMIMPGQRSHAKFSRPSLFFQTPASTRPTYTATSTSSWARASPPPRAAA